MARTLHFLDGSKEVLLLEDDGEFEAIIEERLGKDAAGYFMERIYEAVEDAEERGYDAGYKDRSEEINNKTTEVSHERV